MADLLQVVLKRRSLMDGRVSAKAQIHLHGSDISARDNVSLSLSASNILPTLQELRDRNLIDDAELLRLAYRFCGESVDVEEMLARGRKAPRTASSSRTPANPQSIQVDPASGEESSNAAGGLA